MSFFSKHKNLIPTLFSALLIIIALSINVHAAILATVFLVLGIIVFIKRDAIGTFILNRFFLTKENSDTQDTAVQQPKTAYVTIPCLIDDWLLRYSYEYEICLIDHSAAEFEDFLGKELSFVQEPENPHDENAVAIYCDSVKIGYVYRANHQDMFNSWIEHQEHIFAYIHSIDTDNNTIIYRVGFYKPVARYSKKTYTLVHVNAERRENLPLCFEGEELDVENGIDDEYIVENHIGEIGALPKSAASFIDNAKWATVVFSEFVYNDNYEEKSCVVDIYAQE